MRLSVYLLSDDVASFEEAIQQKYLEGELSFRRITPTTEIAFECEAFLQTSRAKPPKWLDFLTPAFDLRVSQLANSSAAFLLLLRISNRTFAITFGMAFQALDRSKIEPRFGLRVAANTLNPEKVSTLESTLIDSLARNKRTHFSEGAAFSAFELNHHMDCIRRLSGRPTNSQFAKSVSGTDSACISVDCEFSQLGSVCATLLEKFESLEYKTRFPYIDNLESLRKADPRCSELNQLLNDRLQSPDSGRLGLSIT